jgi:hypothetical protein
MYLPSHSYFLISHSKSAFPKLYTFILSHLHFSGTCFKSGIPTLYRFLLGHSYFLGLYLYLGFPKLCTFLPNFQDEECLYQNTKYHTHQTMSIVIHFTPICHYLLLQSSSHMNKQEQNCNSKKHLMYIPSLQLLLTVGVKCGGGTSSSDRNQWHLPSHETASPSLQLVQGCKQSVMIKQSLTIL